MSVVHSFVAPSAPGQPLTTPFHFIMFADMGVEKEFGCESCSPNSAMPSSPGTVPMVNTIIADDLADPQSSTYPAFIAHVGDIAYALNSAWKWDVFFHTAGPLASRVPYLPSIGNHEARQHMFKLLFSSLL